MSTCLSGYRCGKKDTKSANKIVNYYAVGRKVIAKYVIPIPCIQYESMVVVTTYIMNYELLLENRHNNNKQDLQYSDKYA